MNFGSLSALGNVFGQVHDLPLPELPDVTLREHANIGCVLLSAAANISDIVADAESCLGIDLPGAPGAVQCTADRSGIWLTPRSWLLLCDPDDEAEICARVLAAFPDRMLHASPFTDFLCWLSLTGERSEDLLRQGSFISLSKGGLPVGCAKRTPINGIATILYREDDLTWLIGVERSRASYFHHWLDNLNLV